MVRSGAFLQSIGWGNFQRSLGKEVKRIDGVVLVKQELGFGFSYWYCPRGELKTLPTDTIFVRHDQPVEADNYPITQLPNYRIAPHDVQPRTTIILDLKKSEETLLKEMHEKTRYNIRVAERRGVQVEVAGAEAFETFWQLLQITTARDQFRSHAKSYYQKMLQDHHDPNLQIFLAIARVEGKPAASALMIDFAGTRTYLHGASDHTLRDAMAPYALHWFLIKDAKAKGLQAYDLWGIAPDPSTGSGPAADHRLAGVTRFKKGWGGEVVRYPQTQDLILRPWKYRMYQLARKFLARS